MDESPVKNKQILFGQNNRASTFDKIFVQYKFESTFYFYPLPIYISITSIEIIYFFGIADVFICRKYGLIFETIPKIRDVLYFK